MSDILNKFGIGKEGKMEQECDSCCSKANCNGTGSDEPKT